MFDRDMNFPTAVASYDDEGVRQGIDWCVALMQERDVLTVWTHLKSNLRNCRALEELVSRNRNVNHVTGRGHTSVRGSGPILMAWPDMDDIGEVVQFAHGVRGMCVITWNEDNIRPWVSTVQPTILGDGSTWETNDPAPALDPVVIEAMKSLTLTINHNNTIAAGYEKDDVVGILLALHDAGIPMDARAMQALAIASGWSGKNPQRLADYVLQIQSGSRPRIRRSLRHDYVEHLRHKATNPDG